MTQFIAIDNDNFVVFACGMPDAPNQEGPPAPTPPDTDKYTFVPWQSAINFSGSSEGVRLKWVANSVVSIDTTPVEVLKVRKNDEINTMREVANTSFVFRGKEIRCRPLDRSDIDGTNGYIALFGDFPDGWVGAWKAADNSLVAITSVEDWKEFYKAMVDTGNANFLYAQQLKAQLAAAMTNDEVAAIIWEEGNV